MLCNKRSPCTTAAVAPCVLQLEQSLQSSQDPEQPQVFEINKIRYKSVLCRRSTLKATEIIKGMSEFSKCKPKESREADIRVYQYQTTWDLG